MLRYKIRSWILIHIHKRYPENEIYDEFWEMKPPMPNHGEKAPSPEEVFDLIDHFCQTRHQLRCLAPDRMHLTKNGRAECNALLLRVFEKEYTEVKEAVEKCLNQLQKNCG